MKKITIITLIVVACFIMFSLQIAAEDLQEGEDYFTYEGAGDDFIEIEKPEPASIMHITGNEAERHFAVEGYDADGESTDTFVNKTKPYEGTVALDFEGEETTHLEISAQSGDDWTITIAPVFSTEDWVEAPGKITGEDDSIVIIDGEANMADIKGNEAEKHFAVMGWQMEDENITNWDTLVNAVEKYEGTVRLEPNTRILEIKAVGEWTIDVQ